MKTSAFAILLAVIVATCIPRALGVSRDRDEMRDDNMKARIEERMKTRSTKLAEMIEERKIQLTEHQSGRSLMMDEDHERVKRQITNFSRKLEQMSNISPSERDEMVTREMEMLQMHDREHRRLQRDEKLEKKRFRMEHL